VALLPIRVLGDPILREPTRPVTEITTELLQLIDDMFETMYVAEGIGIAAPQVGRRERIAVVEVDEGEKIVLINPEIIAQDGSERAEEGCLSIPEIAGDVDRAAWIVVRALDREGKLFELEASGLLARCIQHEVDHLDGKLFIDYLSLLKRRSAARKWEKEVEQYPGYLRILDPNKPRGRGRRRERSTSAANDHETEL
jgi:peptide deformylase